MLRTRIPLRARESWFFQCKSRRSLSSATSGADPKSPVTRQPGSVLLTRLSSRPLLKDSTESEPRTGPPNVGPFSDLLSRLSSRSGGSKATASGSEVSATRYRPLQGPGSRRGGLTLAKRIAQRQLKSSDTKDVTDRLEDARNDILSSARPEGPSESSPRKVLSRQGIKESDFKTPNVLPQGHLRQLFYSTQRVSLQAQIEKGKQYLGYLSSARRHPPPVGTVHYARVALDRNRQISLELRERSIKIIKDSLSIR